MSAIPDTSLDGYDIFSKEYQAEPQQFWKQLSGSGCPVAHTEKWGGSWMLVRYDDVYEAAQDQERFSSRAVEVAGPIPEPGRGLYMPPITSAPPHHQGHRDLLAPFLSPEAVKEIEPFIRQRARELASAVAAKGGGDAFTDFAQPLALSVLTHILDVPAAMQPQFVDWASRVLRVGPTDQGIRKTALEEIMNFLDGLLAERKAKGGSDVVSHMADATLDGAQLGRKHKLGSLIELVLAGADTTWSTMGSSLWYLASNPHARAELVAKPEMVTSAVEELLRFFAPVTIARIVAEETEVHGRCMRPNQRVIMPLAAANRDPEVFDAPDEVQLDRPRNRHMAFGTGTHRCLGAHLARAELRIAIEEWLAVMPDFELVDPTSVRWAQGQVRGPDKVDIRVVREARRSPVRADGVMATLVGMRFEADGISSFEFAPLIGEHFAAFAPGAHIDVTLPNGERRSYSLCNDCGEADRYVIAVQMDPKGRGGSRQMHEGLRVGSVVRLSQPRNNFRLAEDAQHTVLVAGGIGITPILAMIRRLVALGRSWELYYRSRSRAAAAFLDQVTSLAEAGQGAVHYSSSDDPATRLDLKGLFTASPAGTHFYCCGPTRMLDAFLAAADGVDDSMVHVEHFTTDRVFDKTGAFEVELARTGKTIVVREGETILEAVGNVGIDVPFSCEEGVCGSCEIRVLDGIPDHQDLVLSKQERAANNKMMVCCSRARTAKLVLDL